MGFKHRPIDLNIKLTNHSKQSLRSVDIWSLLNNLFIALRNYDLKTLYQSFIQCPLAHNELKMSQIDMGMFAPVAMHHPWASLVVIVALHTYIVGSLNTCFTVSVYATNDRHILGTWVFVPCSSYRLLSRSHRSEDLTCIVIVVAEALITIITITKTTWGALPDTISIANEEEIWTRILSETISSVSPMGNLQKVSVCEREIAGFLVLKTVSPGSRGERWRKMFRIPLLEQLASTLHSSLVTRFTSRFFVFIRKFGSLCHFCVWQP